MSFKNEYTKHNTVTYRCRKCYKNIRDGDDYYKEINRGEISCPECTFVSYQSKGLDAYLIRLITTP